MIYDRTLEDVNEALTIRDKKVKAFQELTEDDITTLERGLLTINTLNRIESKQAELKGLFNEIGYYNTPITTKKWEPSQIFNITDFERIISNLNVLKDAFFVFTDTPSTPPVSFHYEDINSLEKLLFDLDVMINDVKSRYRQCGTFQCGEVNEN